MRISIVQGPYLPVPPLLGGAVERSMETLGRHWAAAGCQVVHVSRRYPGLPEREVRAGVEHRRVASRDAPAGRLAFRWHELLYCRRALRALPEADIVTTCSLLLPPLLRDRRLGRLVPRIERPPKGQLRFYRHAAALHTVSQDMRRRILAAEPGFAGRVEVLGLPLEGPLAPTTLPPPPSGRQLAFVGRLHPEKGLDLLIRAFRDLMPSLDPDWRLVIVGPHERRAGGGGEDWLRALRALAAPAGARIHFTGPLFDPSALAALLRDSAVFAYPSLAESGEALGLAPLEAMAQGAVPLVSTLPCFADYVTHEENGLVAALGGAEGEARLAAALRRLLSDEALRLRLRGPAFAAAQRYGAQQVAQRHLEAFRRLLAP